MDVFGFLKLFIDQIPSLMALGANLSELIPAARKVVDSLSGTDGITDADIADMNARMDVAEAAWANQVAAAKTEV